MTKEEVENSVNTSEVEHTDKDILRDEDKGPEKDAKKEDTKSSSENELASLKDRLARAYAEIENQRRRFEKEKEEAYEYGGFAFAKEALNLLDNLERSKASLENDESLKDEGSLKKIIEHIDISGYFLKIVHTDFIVQGAIEYLMCKVIPPSNISYQCSFQFQSKVDIISTHISHDLVRQSNKVKFIGRSGGSIQLNTYNEVNEFYFLVMVKHLDDVKDLKLSDDTEPDVVYEFKNMMDLKTYSVSESEKQILDNLTFIIEMLNDIKEKLDFQVILANNPRHLRQIIKDNSDKVVKYLFSDISDAKKFDDEFLDFLNFTNSKLSRNLFNILTKEMKLFGSPFGIQSFDELPMLWMCACIFYCLADNNKPIITTYPGKYNNITIPVIMILIVIGQTIFYLNIANFYHIFVGAYLSMVLLIIVC